MASNSHPLRFLAGTAQQGRQLKASLSLSLNRVATNQKVREQVRLELSFVNSDLQMLKEELEGLNISVGVYQGTE